MLQIIKSLIVAAALAHGVNAQSMLATANCESTFNQFAVNEPNIGLFQLSRYGKLPVFYAEGYDNPFDPAQQANFVAEQFAAGQQRAWSCWYLIKF